MLIQKEQSILLQSIVNTVYKTFYKNIQLLNLRDDIINPVQLPYINY